MDDPYAKLLELRRNEGAVRGLAKIPKEFYTSTSGFLEETRRAFETELRGNPSSRRGEISRQTHQRAGRAARDLIEARMSKILTAAFQASVGGARDLPNALAEERELFDRLVVALGGFRRTAAPFLEPETSAQPAEPTPAQTAPPPHAAEPSVGARGVVASGRLSYVHILRDSRPIQVGADTVDLRQGDILQLPAETAELLVKGKVAEPVRSPGPGPVT